MHVIGIDLGGTNIKAGAVDAQGNLASRVSIETESQHGPDHVLGRMAEAAHLALERADLAWSDIRAVGIGSPGPLDGKHGIVIDSPNIPG